MTGIRFAIIGLIGILAFVLIVWLQGPAPTRSTGDAQLLISEVALRPPCENGDSSCEAWVELRNPTERNVSLAGYRLRLVPDGDAAPISESQTQGAKADPSADGVAVAQNGCPASLAAGERCVIRHGAWRNATMTAMRLEAANGDVLAEIANDVFDAAAEEGRTWQRCGDGADGWQRRPATPGRPNDCD